LPKKKSPQQKERLPLDIFPEPIEPEIKVKPPTHKVWTENKAKLIERYLLYFVFITHHGTYIDGFAGPQDPQKPDSWAAKLVLESEPKWLKHFHLFEIKKKKIKMLNELKRRQPDRDSKGRKVNREVEVYPGDFNINVHKLLRSASIKPKEATFCLLDQITFECHWSTLKALAEYKPAGYRKIELFYFLGVGWLDRAFSGQKKTKKLEDWWGRDDWDQLLKKGPFKCAMAFVERFKQELGYKTVMPWAIFERKGGGRIMYYMIHATDHPDAPGLMSRAYDRAVFHESYEQLQLEGTLAFKANGNK
jgi:three-Cys-motif partner protein